MSGSVDQIKSRIDILTLVGSYLKLERSGASWKARCPFHNEKTPSFFVSPERGSYYCFGCQASGDIFTFVEEFEGLDFKGALKLLADRAGVTLENFSKEDKVAKDEKERLYEAMESAARFFEGNLAINKEVQDYLKNRGLTEKSIKDFRIGFALLEWRKLYDHLKAAKFTDTEIERAGLGKQPEEKDKAMYDRFRGRIMFPITDSSGRVIAFSGRILVDDGKSAKYLNSPETPIFSKSAVLFGIDKAKESIRKNNFSILVEGQMDLVLSHQAGFRNTVATSGTALAETTVSRENVVSNLGLVRRLSSNIVLAFDGDKAGFNAIMRAGKIALSLGMDVKAAALPDGVDPADLVSKHGPEAWKEAVRNSKHIIEFILDKVLKEAGGDNRKAGRLISEKVLVYINALSSSIEKAHFIKKISDASGIPQGALEVDLKKIDIDSKREESQAVSEENSIAAPGHIYRKDYILRKLLGIFFWQKALNERNINTDNLSEDITRILEKGKDQIFKENANKQDLIFEAEVFYGGNQGNLEKDVGELLANLEGEHLKEKLGMKMKELNQAEKVRDATKSRLILTEISEINSRIQKIKK